MAKAANEIWFETDRKGAGVLWMILASPPLAVISFATPALSQDAAPLSQNPAAQSAAAAVSTKNSI
jgi:hypothetical protein